MSEARKVRQLLDRIDRQKVKRVVRTGVYTGVIAGAHVVRSATPVVRRVSPAAADRMDRSTFLQQPTHGKRWQERFYGSMQDPYGFAKSEYEAHKYAHTLRAIESTHAVPVQRSLELGSAEGVFTEMLAGVSEETVGLEVSEIAVGRANQRLAAVPHATVEVSKLPAELPGGQFDVIVASDVLYYFPSDVLKGLLAKLEGALAPGGIMVIVNYMGNFGARIGGPTVHRLCDEVLTIPKVLNERERNIGPDGVSGYQVTVYRHSA